MSTIRPLERTDLPAVIALMRSNFERFDRDRSFVEGTLLDDPWSPEPLPALVSEDEGEIVGFIGAQARRINFSGNEVLGVSVSQFVVDPERRGGGAALVLLRHLFSGPQELTWSEDSPGNVARMWGVLGGGVDHVRTCDWMLVLRPVRWLSRVISRAPREGLPRHRVPVAALPTGALRTRRRMERASLTDIVGHDATAREVAAELPALSTGLRLRVDYDEQHLDHTLKQWASVAGDLVSRLVRRRGRTIGWYVYIPRPGGASRLLHAATLARESDAVIAELIADAHSRGSTVLSGRLEPHLSESLRSWHPAVALTHRPVFHTRNAELREALSRDTSLLTELDSVDSSWL